MNDKRQTQEMIQDIVQRIVAGYSPQKIILFGSYAYGEPDEDSDIDLLTIKDTNKRPIERWDVLLDTMNSFQTPCLTACCNLPLKGAWKVL